MRLIFEVWNDYIGRDKFNEILEDFYCQFFKQKIQRNKQSIHMCNNFLFDDLINCIESHFYWLFVIVWIVPPNTEK